MGAVLTLPLVGKVKRHLSPPPTHTHGAQTPGSVSNSQHSLSLASGLGTPLGTSNSGPESGSAGAGAGVAHPVFLLVLNCELPAPPASAAPEEEEVEEVPSMEDVPGSAPSLSREQERERERADAEDRELRMWKELNARANRVAEKLFGSVSVLAASPVFANPTPALLHPRPPTTAGSQT